MSRFEEALREIDEIVKKLDDRDTDIEEAVKLFERGKELIEYCREFLSETEERMEVINR
jgi:exodeoxyribonuclease VII small subunit